jgi:hypothetical protein
MIIRKSSHSEETHVNSIVSENVEDPRSDWNGLTMAEAVLIRDSSLRSE